MKKSKYEKPIGHDLNTMLPVQGSCNSGWGYVPNVWGDCYPGAAASPVCSAGGDVIPAGFCTGPGTAAGAACWNGSWAG